MRWWVVNQVSRPGGPRGPQQTNYVVVQAATRPINAIAGPYATKAEAQGYQNDANAYGNSPASAASQTARDAVSGLTSQLHISGIASWFFRGLKIVFGGILIIIGVSKFTGADNKIIALASKVPVLP